MIEKYEHFIEQHYEPYTTMHESRPHSNLAGKELNFGNKALQSDPIGWYKELGMQEDPSESHFHEAYPLMADAWVYDFHYMQEDFDYNDIEGQYLA